jgi:hypothetical protein
MLETYTSLLTTTKKYLSITVSTLDTELAKELNYGRRYILTRLRQVGWIYQNDPDSIQTIDGVDTYYYLPTTRPPIESATYQDAGGGNEDPLEIIQSQEMWNRLTMVDFVAQGAGNPMFILPLADKFKLYPTPGSTGDVVKLWTNPMYADMGNADYTTGTITLTNASTTVIGTGTTFTSAMVGRWIKADSEGVWYKIASYTNATTLQLTRTYVGSTTSGLAYTIGETPQLPNELHELLPHYAAAKYWAGQKGDPAKAQTHMNFFYTGDFGNTSRQISTKYGGLLGAMAAYAGRDNGALVDMETANELIGEKWSITLT